MRISRRTSPIAALCGAILFSSLSAGVHDSALATSPSIDREKDVGERHVGAQLSEECRSLMQLFVLPRADLLTSTTRLQTRAFDAGDDCVPALVQRLSDSSSIAVGAAAYALSVIGSAPAVAAVRSAVSGAAGNRARANLSPELSANSGEHILAAQYFVEAIRGPRLSLNWIPRHDAALTLGVLRAKESSDALRTAVGPADQTTYISQAASAALSWMERTPCNLEDTPGRDVSTAIALTMLRCGIPTFQMNPESFLEQRFDRTSVRVWSFAQRDWTYREVASGDSTMWPKVQFRTSFSDDSTRVTANVHTSFGPNNVTVYRYLLRKTGSVWRVTAIAFAGVA